MNRRKLIVLIPLLLIGSVGLAIWISGWSLTGNITVVSGEEPSLQTETFDLDINSSTILEGNETFNYNNGDGTRIVDFELTEYINSTDSNCILEDQDIEFYVDVNSVGEAELIPGSLISYTINPGENDITIRYQLHENHCGLTGNYSVSFVA